MLPASVGTSTFVSYAGLSCCKVYRIKLLPMNPQPPVTRMRMAARTSSAERDALVESAPATARAGEYLHRWEVHLAGTDWVPWLILALAALLRFFLLGMKPPHFDEGINGWFVD